MERTYISSKSKLFDFRLRELINYRDLILLFVKRNITAQYKQTILGPLWFLINPLVSTVLYSIVFGGIAGLGTDGVPHFAFYLSGICIWQYFSTCVTGTANTFVANSGIMGKVYFPRLVIPISTVMYSGINFLVVFICTIISCVYYMYNGSVINLGISLLIVPILFIQTALFSLGIGVIISALTTKYRDLQILVSFGMSLWMYITPVVYSMDNVPASYAKLIMINPMTPIVNNFRFCVLGVGQFEMHYWLISVIESFCVLLIGVILFNHVEKSFMDTV